jgi:hypothetical protein
MTVEPKEICGCCKQDREKEGKSPRSRVEVTVKDADPVLLCEFCDGDALPNAKAVEEKRLSGE